MARVTASEYQEYFGGSPIWYSETLWSAVIATFIIAAIAGYLIKANENVTVGIGTAIGAVLFGIIFAATGAAASGMTGDGILHGLLLVIPGSIIGALGAMAGGGVRDSRDRKRRQRQEQAQAQAQRNDWRPPRPKKRSLGNL